MKQDTEQDHISKKAVVYRIPGMDRVRILRDAEYRTTDAGALTMDIYYPPDLEDGERAPAVIFVAGYPDPGFQRVVGCKLKEMEAYVSWGQLTAASGLVAITYTNREPEADIHSLLQYLQQNGAGLGIDKNRIGVWACSGNVPLTLSILIQDSGESLRCAVLCYGFMPDRDGASSVAEAARTWGFVNPCAGRAVDDLPQDLPLFIVRAGEDQTPYLNQTIDYFVVQALVRNLPFTLANHAAAPHAFDLLDASETSRAIIKQILAFWRLHLLTIPGAW